MPFTELPNAFLLSDSGIFSLALYTTLVVLLIAVVLFLAGRLGRKKESHEKSRPYECGIIPAGGRRPIPVPFFLFALFFLVFDVEGAFVFSWAIALRELGWRGWLQISLFIVLLLASLIYIWAKGGLEWKQGIREKGP